MNTAKAYKDSGGNDKTIHQVLRKEPYWAANRIQCGEVAEQRVRELESTIKDFIECQPMTGEDGREYQQIFKSLMDKK